jgi:hypothetical protein
MAREAWGEQQHAARWVKASLTPSRQRRWELAKRLTHARMTHITKKKKRG